MKREQNQNDKMNLQNHSTVIVANKLNNLNLCKI